jgi:putative ABC transport system permease protein
VAQVALALVLLVGAGLLIRSFVKLHSVAPGFQPDHVVTMELSLPRSVYDRAGRAAFVERLSRESATVPGIRFAAMTTQLPLTGDNMNFALTVEGRPSIAGEVSPSADVHAVTPDYFRTLGAPLLQGRSFSTADTAQSPHVFVVNQALVRRYFAGRNPLGKRLTIGVNSFDGEIVGVVADIRHLGLDAPVHEELFTDYVQTPFWPTLSLAARTSGDPALAAAALRARVSAIDKDQPIAKVRTMRQIVGASIAQPRFRTLLLALFGALAVVLAAVGLSGVLAYSVAQRTREIGVRIALGARTEDVLRLVVGQGMSLALAGIGIGLAVALALTRLLSGLLYGVGANDPATFVGIAFLLVVVAAAASYFPARRASKVDPIVALRYE